MKTNNETYIERVKKAESRIDQLKFLQSQGLICADGDFVPSVHYPPITRYPIMTEDELYSTYTMPEDGRLDIYVHFPFCKQHCVFCHYPGKIGLQTEEKPRYIGFLKREIDLYMSRFGLDRITPRSVLIGGGTPTYLEPYMLEDFLEYFNNRVDISKCKQFNYDVDPNTLVGEDGLERLRIMKRYGVTRLTIGIQSFDDEVLRRMNRPHDSETAIRSIYNVKEAGFDLNIEFIYGHPGETFKNWSETIEKAVTLPTDEIQIYRLKVLAYGDRQGDVISSRSDVLSFEQTMTMKQMAIDILNENGFYENIRRVYTKSKKNISHYAYNQCCNLFDQVGFGITGFSSYRDRFALNTQYFSEYYKSIDEGRLPMNRGYIRDAEQQLRWSIILPIKNMDVKKARFKAINGIPFDRVFQTKIENLKKFGLIEETERVVRLTELGAFVADEVAEQFNDNEFMPFPQENFADGPLNPYKNNTRADAFGTVDDKGETGVFSGIFSMNTTKMNSMDSMSADDIIENIASGSISASGLIRGNIKKLVMSEGETQMKLFELAQQTRNNIFDNKLKVRGVIEISNACVKNCDYCAMRRDNHSIDRYNLSEETILDTAEYIADSGITTIFLQAGQNSKCDAILQSIIPYAANKLECEVLLCLGEKSEVVYNNYRDLGAASYILKFESSNPELYSKIAHSSLQNRLDCISYIKETGMKLGTGNIIGLPGQTIDDIVNDILLAISLNPDFVSSSPFIANSGTPFEHIPCGDINLTLNTIAVLRLALPNALIPTVSALEYIHPSGQAAGLNAGANVMTVNFTPKASRDKYAIYAKDRFVVSLEHVLSTAEKAGMVPNLRELQTANY